MLNPSFEKTLSELSREGSQAQCGEVHSGMLFLELHLGLSPKLCVSLLLRHQQRD